jgi:antirestriction protein ArdC
MTQDANHEHSPNQRHDVYARVTNKIIAELESGVRPWVKPWDEHFTTGRITKPLRSNAVPYKGINVLLLWAEAVAKGYRSPFWITFRQATEWNAHVRRGEKAALVVYASSVQKVEKSQETGEGEERSIPFLKGYSVFNAEQIEGLPAIFQAKPDSRFESEAERIQHAELFFRNTKATIRERGGQAYYAQAGDYIQVPPIEAFREPADFYSTLAHETIHWTKHPSRLAREFGRKAWGDEGYATEELVAELGSAFLAADLEIRPIPPAENASYIDHWLRVLKGDKRAIFSAASHAQRAADYLHGLQPAPPPADGDLRRPDADAVRHHDRI